MEQVGGWGEVMNATVLTKGEDIAGTPPLQDAPAQAKLPRGGKRRVCLLGMTGTKVSSLVCREKRYASMVERACGTGAQPVENQGKRCCARTKNSDEAQVTCWERSDRGGFAASKIRSTPCRKAFPCPNWWM